MQIPTNLCALPGVCLSDDVIASIEPFQNNDNKKTITVILKYTNLHKIREYLFEFYVISYRFFPTFLSKCF